MVTKSLFTVSTTVFLRGKCQLSSCLRQNYSLFLQFLFNLGKYVNSYERISFFLLYLTLVTSWIIDPFLCCHLLYLIIYFIGIIYFKFLTFLDSLIYIKSSTWKSLLKGPRQDIWKKMCTLDSDVCILLSQLHWSLFLVAVRGKGIWK